MKLQQREIPLVTFRRDLPDFLAGGEPCYIEIEARAGGYVNPAYVKAMEDLQIAARIMDRKRAALENDPEAFVRAAHDDPRVIGRMRFGVLYDTCILAWRTNILDDGKPAETTRANFIALAEAPVGEIATMLFDLEKEIIAAGNLLKEDQDATVKN